jgi:SAM-dependent methyltransferase
LSRPPPKYTRYQDYVIRDGRFVGEFEQMYRDFPDPWSESRLEKFASDKAAAINLLGRLKELHGARRVVEIGCGFGHFSQRIAQTGLQVLGVDVSETAVATARARVGGVSFQTASIGDHAVLREFQPDVIVLAEVTWYVLDSLREFMAFLRTELPNAFLLHLLTTYPAGVQKYGADFFTDLEGIKGFLAMQWLESGEVHIEGGTRTWLLGTWKADVAAAWREFQ